MKQQRHTAIRDLLVRTTVTNQDELRKKLAGRGFHVTQATLSRDIRELNLSKGPTGYALPNSSVAVDDEDELPGIKELLTSFGLQVKQAINQLVLVTTTSSCAARRRQPSTTRPGTRSSEPSPGTTPY